MNRFDLAVGRTPVESLTESRPDAATCVLRLDDKIVFYLSAMPEYFKLNEVQKGYAISRLRIWMEGLTPEIFQNVMDKGAKNG